MNQNQTRNILVDERGTAFMEAVLMFPVMALCWAGVFFYLSGFDKQLEAARDARLKAWTLSNNACESAEDQMQCAGSSGGGNAADSTDWMDKVSAIEDVPLIGWLFASIFGYTVDVDMFRKWKEPLLLGGDQMQSGYHYHIMCNEKKMSFDDLVVAMLCEQLGYLGIDLSWLGIDCPEGDSRTKSCSESSPP